MSQTPSAPILALFRKLLAEKQLNTAALAELTKLKRGHVRQVLGGKKPLTVDEMVLFATALEVDMQSLAGLPEDLPEAAPVDLRPAEGVTVDPFGLHAEQAIKLAFAMGCNFAVLADTTQLAERGIPRRVLDAHPEMMLIQLDAAFHRHNEPRYDDDGLQLTLSFNGICQCAFPWSSILEVRFAVERPDPGPQKGKPGTPDAPRGGPVLRLVT